jgi:hypothetical protein
MRCALVLCVSAGCLIQPGGDSGGDYPPPDDGWGSGWGGGGGSTSYGCHLDSECESTQVCARDGNCTAATSVRIVHVMWTLKGQPASDTSCRYAPKLSISFSDVNGGLFGFAPVPCNAGKFTVDKMPSRYTWVDLARDSDYEGGGRGMFDASGNVTLDLNY